MNMPAKWVALTACILALSGVVMAALGSHLVDLQGVERGESIWRTATTLHLFGAAAILAMSAWLNATSSKTLLWASWMLIMGTVIFCASLYMRVISAGTLTGAAPAGGLIMMSGWLVAIWALLRR